MLLFRLDTILFLLLLFLTSNLGLSCHKTFSQESSYIEGCPFCDAISSFEANKMPDHFDRTVIASSSNNNFFAKTQRGGYLPGSILIASKNHHIARISDMTQEEFREFLDFYEAMKDTIFDLFGHLDYIAFENGTIGSDTAKEANEKDTVEEGCRLSGGGCLTHFHWHFSPLQKIENQSASGFLLPSSAKPLGNWKDFFHFIKSNPQAIYTLIDYQGKLYLVDRRIHQRRSEWMRLLIGTYLMDEGMIDGHYSWRKSPRFETSLETLKIFNTIIDLTYNPL